MRTALPFYNKEAKSETVHPRGSGDQELFLCLDIGCCIFI